MRIKKKRMLPACNQYRGSIVTYPEEVSHPLWCHKEPELWVWAHTFWEGDGHLCFATLLKGNKSQTVAFPQFFFFLVILFACEVAAAIWGFMNRDTVGTAPSLQSAIPTFPPWNISAELPVVLRSPRSWSTSTTRRTLRPWTCQEPPAKTLPSRCWTLSTGRYVGHEETDWWARG